MNDFIAAIPCTRCGKVKAEHASGGLCPGVSSQYWTPQYVVIERLEYEHMKRLIQSGIDQLNAALRCAEESPCNSK